MLNLLKSTEVNKFLSKEKLIDKLDLSSKLKASLKDDVKRFNIANELSPKSMNITKGETVLAIFLMEVQLKKKNISYKLLESIAKQNPNKILFMLSFEDEIQLAVFFGKLYIGDWQKINEISLNIKGENFDEVWDNIITQIALRKTDITENKNNVPVTQQLTMQEEMDKLKKEITRLEKLARTERQPKHKFDIVGKVSELKKKLEEI